MEIVECERVFRARDNTYRSCLMMDGEKFIHEACIMDFAGNHNQNGFWADLWISSATGERRISLGGEWGDYVGVTVPEWVFGDAALQLEETFQENNRTALYQLLRTLSLEENL